MCVEIFTFIEMSKIDATLVFLLPQIMSFTCEHYLHTALQKTRDEF